MNLSRIARRLAVNLAVLAAGLVAALVLLEILLRIHNPFFSRIRGEHIVLTVNRTIHFKNNTIRGLEPDITFTRNSIGLRGPDPPRDFDKHLTLVTIGGSTTLCMWITDEKTWPALLGRRLARSFRDLWLDNAGMEGHSTFGHLALVKDYIVPLHPKVALLLVGANDVGRETNSEWDSENTRTRLIFVSFKSFLKSASAYSEVAALVLDAYRSMEARRSGLGHMLLDIRKQGTLKHSERDFHEYVTGFITQPHKQHFGERVRALIGLCRAGDIEPILLTQPLVFGNVIDDTTGINLATVQIRGALNGEFMWTAQEAYNDVTREACRDSGVLLVDLAREMPKSSRYFYDAMHFTNAGAAKVAEIVSNDLCPVLARRYPEYVKRDCSAMDSLDTALR